MYSYNLSFKLNNEQLKVSKEVKQAFLNKQNIILDAVCGAGKTEMLLETLKIALNNNYIVGFACPRRQLLIDLYKRITTYFAISEAGLVTGYYKKNPNSNFIFLTCHQLLKYPNYFDLLIIDEIDAFPFCNNNELEQAAFQSSKQFILLSATVPKKYYKLLNENKFILITNYLRHHLQPMPLPELKKVNYGLMSIYLILLVLRYQNNPLLIYASNIKLGKKIEKLLKFFLIKTTFVYAKNLNESIINKFIKQEIKTLISTTVLERGLTFKKVNVIVFKSDANIFDERTLLQICGRVGRDSKYSKGDIIFLANFSTDAMKNCNKKIVKYNEMCSL